MRAQARGLATGLALAAVLLVAGCGDDSDQSAGVGDLVQGRLDDVDGTSHTVLLPTGSLTVDVADGVDSIGATKAADGQEHQAPDGAQWVTLDWHLDSGAGLDPLQRTLMNDPAQRVTLELVAGDVSVDLGDAPGATSTPADVRTGGVVYVAVPTDSSPVIKVGFDGETTTLDLGTGDVSGDHVDALTDLAPPVSAECPPLRGKGVSADIACTYTVTTVPYLAQEGWSTGDGWTVGRVETRSDSFTRAGSTYLVRDTADGSGFDGDTGTSVVNDARLTSLVTSFFVDGTPSRLDIVRTLTGLRSDGQGPEDVTVELRATVDLG